MNRNSLVLSPLSQLKICTSSLVAENAKFQIVFLEVPSKHPRINIMTSN